MKTETILILGALAFLLLRKGKGRVEVSDPQGSFDTPIRTAQPMQPMAILPYDGPALQPDVEILVAHDPVAPPTIKGGKGELFLQQIAGTGRRQFPKTC